MRLVRVAGHAGVDAQVRFEGLGGDVVEGTVPTVGLSDTVLDQALVQRSEQLPELLGVHADDPQDVPQSSPGCVAARVDRDDDRPAIGDGASRDDFR